MSLSASRCRKNFFRNIKYEIILEAFKSNHLQAYEKEYWRLSGYKKVIREDRHRRKEKKEIFHDKPSNGKLLCKKIVMLKAALPPSISKETVVEFCEKLTDLKSTHFWRKVILTKSDRKLRLKFAPKVCYSVVQL